jgi:hypothetical protein
VFSSSAGPAGRFGALRHKPLARTGPIRRFIRIGMLLTVIVVRPRWRPLLAGVAFTAFGAIAHQGVFGLLMIPGMLSLWLALLTPGDTADRERRSQLKRELAAYSTPAQRRDLEATLDRYPDGITYEIRDILASQAVVTHHSGIPGTRSY